MKPFVSVEKCSIYVEHTNANMISDMVRDTVKCCKWHKFRNNISVNSV